jgi:hypothetical protein
MTLKYLFIFLLTILFGCSSTKKETIEKGRKTELVSTEIEE